MKMILGSLAPHFAKLASSTTPGTKQSVRRLTLTLAGVAGGATALGIAWAECQATSNVFSWGRHAGGNVSQPKPLDFSGKKVQSLAFSLSHSAAVDADGNIWVWKAAAEGVQQPALIVTGKNAVKVACGKDRIYALTKSGSVLYWQKEDPQSIKTLSIPSGTLGGLLGGGSAKDICAFGSQFGVVTSGGEAFALGLGAKGQLGHGKVVAEEKELVKIQLPSGTSAKTIALGSNHTVVLSTRGQLFACGANNQLQLGQDTKSSVKEWVKNEEDSSSLLSPIPLQVQLPSNIKDAKYVDVGAGEDFTAAIAKRTDGSASLVTFGSGLYGQLGHKSIKNVSEPRTLASMEGYAEWNEKLNKKVIISPKSLACGEEHTLVLLDNGVVMSWGSGREFQLGNNSQAMQKVPTLVMPLTQYKASKIFAGARTSAITY